MKTKPTPPVEGIVVIAHAIHTKSEESLQNVLEWLGEDYDVKDCSKDEHHPHEGYYAHLKDSVRQSYAKCDYCGHYSTRLGCKCHGYKCEGCGKVLYKEYVHRAPVRLYFRRDQGMKYLNFLIHSYDDATQRLLVYAKPQQGRSWCSLPLDKSETFLKQHEGDFERLVVDGKNLIAFYYPIHRTDENVENVKIGIMEVGNAPYKKVKNPAKAMGYDYIHDDEDMRCHYRMVQLYKGEEYEGDFGYELPVYESFMVYPTYKHAPAVRNDGLSAKIIHAAGQVADCGYYCQDGRQAFYDIQLEWMALYIEHFTDLNVNNFRKFLRICKKDGPGFIVQLAEYVGAETGVIQHVENRPNIGNVLVGMSKMMSGSRMTSGEVEAMNHAFRDQKVREEWDSLIESVKPT